MGNGIAHVFCLHGYRVQLFDTSPSALEKALYTIGTNLDRQIRKEIISQVDKARALENLSISSNLEDSVKHADLVVEAVPEDLIIKKEVFEKIDGLLKKDGILASNTSSISITRLASFTNRPERVIGMHFMNPVPVMELVELIRGYQTGDQTLQTVIEVSKKIGKSPVEVHDYPGFISNRILMPMINEAIQALFEGVAGVAEIDTIMKLGMAHPMGPLQLADYIGLDVCLSILEVMYRGLGHPKYAPCPLLVNMVQAGRFGRKSGEGFYSWEKGKDPEVAKKFC